MLSCEREQFKTVAVDQNLPVVAGQVEACSSGHQNTHWRAPGFLTLKDTMDGVLQSKMAGRALDQLSIACKLRLICNREISTQQEWRGT